MVIFVIFNYFWKDMSFFYRIQYHNITGNIEGGEEYDDFVATAQSPKI